MPFVSTSSVAADGHAIPNEDIVRFYRDPRGNDIRQAIQKYCNSQYVQDMKKKCSYQAKPEDTLLKLARLFKIDITTLACLNGMSPTQKPTPGKPFCVPTDK